MGRVEIGIPKEIMAGERRVALVPGSAARLVAAGHHVLVETGAGAQAFFAAGAYADAGGQVVPASRRLFAQVELVLKVGAPARPPSTGYRGIDLLRAGP